MLIEYSGDNPSTNRIVSWFQNHMQALSTCISANLPEASLIIIYAGIDTLGFLASPANAIDASEANSKASSGAGFREWCELFIVPRIWTLEGQPLSANDLWAARCGMLHTSTPLSTLERRGSARQVWYKFLGQTGVNLITDSALPPIVVDVESLAFAFRDGGRAFISELDDDPIRFSIAAKRAQHFLRWGMLHP